MTLETIDLVAHQQFDPLWDEAMEALVEEVMPILLQHGAPPEASRVLKLAVFRALEIGRDHWHCEAPREPPLFPQPASFYQGVEQNRSVGARLEAGRDNG